MSGCETMVELGMNPTTAEPSVAAARSTRMPTSDQHSWGAHITPTGDVRFRIWAPDHRELSIAIEGEPRPLVMSSLAGGWFQLTTDRARAGSRYQYVLGDGRRLPDPASRFQPHDVHGMSEVIDLHSHAWKDEDWAGRPRAYCSARPRRRRLWRQKG
jgi:1,4-alpha-glucan branching enzyme